MSAFVAQLDVEVAKSLHDAELIAICWIAERDLRLDMRIQRQEFALLLVNVSILRVVDFGRQNVISHVWHSGDHLASDDFLREGLDWATSTTDSRSYLREEKAADLISSIRSSQKAMIGIVPSVGAELVAVCERLEVCRRGA